MTTILDQVMPDFDAVIVRRRVVNATPATTFAAVGELDLMTVRSPLLTTSMWLRALPSRLTGKMAAPPPRLMLVDGGLPGWQVFGRSDTEIAFGAVGRFWTPTIEWRDVPSDTFRTFDEPGWGKIAAHITVTPCGANQTLLTYQCRTVTTDSVSRRRFLRYWRVIRPFVGHVLSATLRTVAATSDRRCPSPPSGPAPSAP